MTLPRRAPTPIIQLDDFEGPLDLLLTLVERRRLPIAELSLVAVADQYLAQVRALDRVDPDALSEFLAVGARLLLLKSRALLPAIEPPAAPEGEDAAATGDELVRRLEAYKIVKELAAALRQREEEGLAAYTRGARPVDLQPDSVVLQAIAPTLLASLVRAIEERRRPAVPESGPPAARATVAERLALLRTRLAHQRRLAWDEVCGRTVDQIVATLLAVLELVRRGELLVRQAALFGPIHLEAAEPAPVGASGA